MTKKLYIKTYGCQMNVYDTIRMQDVLTPLGYAPSDTPVDADLVILNTCHIREKAEEKVYSDLGRVRQEKEKATAEGRPMLIAVGGCVAQAEGEEVIRRAPFVDMVFGPQSYHLLPELITKATREKGGAVELDFPAEPKFDYLPEAGAQGVSAFLSIQEGCDKFCTFCVVPYTRGAEYSRNVASIEAEARMLVDKGAREITLLGQNVNAYHGLHSTPSPLGGGLGWGLNKAESPNNAPLPTSPLMGEEHSWSLAELIDRLAQIRGLERIRYTTSHPRDMSDDLIAIHGSEPKLMPFLHLPVQSGSDEILRRMNRKHDAAFYLDIIQRLRKARPDIAFSSDFIVGFPGETEQHFDDTMKLIAEVQYASAYSFKYSPRPGTPAATAEQIAEEVKSERLQRLQALLNHQQLAFNAAYIGRTLPVLFDRKGKLDNQLIGKTPYMQSVHVANAGALHGQIVNVTLTAAHANSMAGVLAPAYEIETAA